jgi:hypothetical protein
MLNLPVAMIKELLLVFVSLFWLSPGTAIVPDVKITSPQAGQVLQGSVDIRGSVSSDQFVSAELSYAYSQNDTATWFLIATVSQPVTENTLAVWDTSTISDGDYKIKLTVKMSDGTTQETVVDPVLVRNYTAVQSTATSMPTSVQTEVVSVATAISPTETLAPVASVTPFPANQASLTTGALDDSLRTGLILGLLIVVVISIYSYIRYLHFHR